MEESAKMMTEGSWRRSGMAAVSLQRNPERSLAQLKGLIAALKTRNDEVRQEITLKIKSIVEELKKGSPDEFSRLMQEVNQTIFKLVQEDPIDLWAGIGAIGALLDVVDPTAAQLAQLGNYTRLALRNSDKSTVTAATRTLGRLAKKGGVLTAEHIEREAKKALEALSERDVKDIKLYTAVLVVKELALNVPALFFPYVEKCIKPIWTAIRDSSLHIREAGCAALRALLDILSTHADSHSHAAWYTYVWEQCKIGLKSRDSSLNHGALLCVGDVFHNTGPFLYDKYPETYRAVAAHRDNSNIMIRLAVLRAIPALAWYARIDFRALFLSDTLVHLYASVKKDNKEERVATLAAIAELSAAVGTNAWKPHSSTALQAVKGVIERKSKFTPEALPTYATLAAMVPPGVEKQVADFIDPLYAGGVSYSLAEALETLVMAFPSLKNKIQSKLLDSLSKALTGQSHTTSASISDTSPPRFEDIHRALRILRTFDFHPRDLGPFVRDCIIKFLDDESAVVRKEAALTCAAIAVPRKHAMIVTRGGNMSPDRSRARSRSPSSHVQPSRALTKISEVALDWTKDAATTRGHKGILVSDVVERLLSIAVADPDPQIRLAIFSSLDGRFANHLATVDSLRFLFMSISDEEFEIRMLVTGIVAKLAPLNPSHVLPCIRKQLLQLLTVLEHSVDYHTQNESLKLLTILTRSAPKVMATYTQSVVDTLKLRMNELMSDADVAISLLNTVSATAEAVGEDMLQYLRSFLPLIIKVLKGRSSAPKLDAALRALGSLVQFTGHAIKPYEQYPDLLPVLFSILKCDTSDVTLRETIKVLGIIGALDPFRKKILDIERTEATHMEALNMKSEGYFTKVVLKSLVVIMNDATLQTYHKSVVQTIVNTCKSTHGNLSQVLSIVLPPFISILRKRGPDTDLTTTKYLLGQLSVLVPLCGVSINQYLSSLHLLVTTFFNKEATLGVVLHLIAELATACPADFKAYLPPLLPRVLIILKNDSLPDETISLRCLKILSCLGDHLNEFLHQVIPTIMELVSHEGSDLPPYYQGLQSAALKTLRRIGKVLRLEDHASAIIHPLLRVMTKPESIPLRGDIMGVLCMMVHQLGSDYAVFIPIVHKAVTAVHYTHRKYSALIERLLKNQVLPAYNTLDMDTAEIRYLNELLNVPLEEVPTLTDEEVKLRENSTKLQVNQKAVLKALWEAANVVTKDGWVKWLRSFSLELLQQSPHIAFKLSANLASQLQPFTRGLFNAAFVSVWCNIRDTTQEQLCVELESILTNSTLPPEVLGMLLNLIEFMDANDMAMPIDPQLLSNLATKTSALAKTLRWKEIAFQIAPQVTIERLVTIYNQLGHTHSALGLLHVAEKSIDSTNKESWYERLEKWELALEALEKERDKLNELKVPDGGARMSIGSNSSNGDDTYAYFQKVTEIEMRMMRCLNALGEWKQLHSMTKASWNTLSATQRSDHEQDEEDEGDTLQHAIAPLATAAAWRMGDWTFMVDTVEKLPAHSYDYFFHKAILSLKSKDDKTCQWAIDMARDSLAQELTTLVPEGYERSYKCIVQAQQLAEIEEIQLMRNDPSPERGRLLKNGWMTRLKGCTNSVQHWDGILQVRSLFLDPVDDCGTWLKFTSLCRNQGKHKLEKKTLQMLLGCHREEGFDPDLLTRDVGKYNPRVSFAYFKHLWAIGEKKPAYSALSQLVSFLKARRSRSDDELLARCCLKLGDWSPETGNRTSQKAMDYYREAMFYDQKWYRAWHAWALANQKQGHVTAEGSPDHVEYITSAINGYIKSITLGPSHASVLQDILRLLTLWFLHGTHQSVETAVSEGFNLIKLDVWLLVIPQIIARVHTKDNRIAGLVGQLLRRIGKEFPQSLVYPLTVCAKSTHADRKQAASKILEIMREDSAALVEQCEFVSNELIRVAIIWHEMWHLGIEEASKLFFGSKDVEGMLRSLFPLHNMMKKTETLREVSFVQAHGRDLEEAFEWCQNYLRTGDEQAIHQAWELYYSTYKKLRKVIPVDYTTLELQYCSPRLVMAKNLDITVPGLPHARTAIRIQSFHPQMDVMLSKQRPRKMSIHGSDGKEYKFLLKGHEDLRLDERVMQLFGLVNALLQSDTATAMKTALQIQRYPVIPLNSNVGLIGWVDNTDTLHTLVKEFRERKKMRINVEYQHMVQLCYQQDQAYEHLPLINKVELFEYMMENTTGQDLYKVLWLQSGTAEVWVERRTTYTLSLATMSMVGYILGLGDRHPNNLMLQRVTGKVVHIDFGDCFEVAMLREKFPEKIPFRLTRMLRGAMEVSGIEGNFRHACHDVMRVQREHKGSVMAMLEAFVHDPLLQWRILRADKGKDKVQDAEAKNATMRKNMITEYLEQQLELEKPEDAMPPRKDRAEDEKELMAASVRGDEGVIANQEPTGSHKGVQLLKRIDDKLNGKDFERVAPEEGLDITKQVDRLINQASSVENLCQCYIGWCPFW
eukprot:TRINITY_DN2882_c0_g1_i3.p1 TRINITY_DN2882_c0_g1~~TRINITY_DN2882_c0_g1_i3.p1  ORF type:complete len:2463 (+),score=482.32 TRINITY_DN2882_c0_g1_i3:61-7449(+)